MCVSQEKAYDENVKTAKVIKIVGWVFLGLMIVYLPIGLFIASYCMKSCEQARARQNQYMAQQAQTESVSVTVPAGMSAGQTLQVVMPSGAMMAAAIPLGSMPGSTFIVQGKVAPQAPPTMPQPGLVGSGGSSTVQPMMPQQTYQPVNLAGSPRQSCCCEGKMPKLWIAVLPTCVFALVAIGCIAGGYDYNLHGWWNGCKSS